MSSDSSPPAKTPNKKRKRVTEIPSNDDNNDDEPDDTVQKQIRPVLLPDIEIDEPTHTKFVRIDFLSNATIERTERLGESAQQYFSDRLRESEITSIDTLPTEGILDLIHIHGMRLAAAEDPPRFRVLQPSALLGIGVAAQQFVLHRLKPLLQDHIAAWSAGTAPMDDNDKLDRNIQHNIAESPPEAFDEAEDDDRPSTQLPESSNPLHLQLPKSVESPIRDTMSEKSEEEAETEAQKPQSALAEAPQSQDEDISIEEELEEEQVAPEKPEKPGKPKKRKERVQVTQTAAAHRPKRSKKS